MKRSTKIILEAVASLLGMAVATGGYLLMLFIAGILIMSPLWYSVAYVVINIMTIGYHLSPVSNKVIDWISDQVESAYIWLRFRPRKHNGVVVYNAVFI